MTQRNTTIRDRHRRAIAKDQPPCSYEHCLHPDAPIDYNAPHLDPLAFTVDHTIPLHKGGEDELHNKTAMHRACNRHKSATIPEGMEAPPRTFVTTLTW
jgi:5-methylcytosine-specific restriction endonuclease McrA